MLLARPGPTANGVAESISFLVSAVSSLVAVVSVALALVEHRGKVKESEMREVEREKYISAIEILERASRQVPAEYERIATAARDTYYHMEQMLSEIRRQSPSEQAMRDLYLTLRENSEELKLARTYEMGIMRDLAQASRALAEQVIWGRSEVGPPSPDVHGNGPGDASHPTPPPPDSSP